MSLIVCRPRSLPLDKLEAAQRRAIELNPANALERRRVTRTPAGRVGGERRIAVLVARKWPPSGARLSVSFLDNPSQALRSRILAHMNAWGRTANVAFSATNGTGQVRIARLDSPPDMAGYWSYLGTEILEIEEDQPTLNLEGFTMSVSEAEFRRVVRHEAGHTLGFEHEHMRGDLVRRIDRKKAIAYFDRTEGWSPEEVEDQVLTPLAQKSIMGTTESDPLSIMCYQLPAAIMKKGKKAIAGGKDINAKDAAFAARIYPKKPKAPEEASGTADTTSAPPRVATGDAGGREAFHIVVLDERRPENGEAPAGKDTPEFAQVLATYGGARVVSAIRLRAPAGPVKKGRAKRAEPPPVTAFGRIIAMHERIRNYTNNGQGSLPTDDELVRFGSDLFETLLNGDVRRLYDEARVREQRRLDVVLTSMIPWIAEKPWEFAFDSARQTFLATEETHFVRNVLTGIPSDHVRRERGPLRMLVVSAQPVGFGRLSIDQEVAVIRRGFEPLVAAGLATVDVRARTMPSDLHGLLSTRAYQIVHFIGHGIYDETRGGALLFETSRGTEFRLGEREAREIFCGRGLSLVFLNACESGRGGRADFNKGLAQSFVQHGLPAVVANQYTVLDSSATSFAQHFYWSLAQGMALGPAAREARIAVNYSLNGELIDWAIPVLYARDAHATLCEPASTPGGLPVELVGRSMHRTSGRDVRVAVWDLDDVFPSLERTLAAMNAVQSTFGFEVVRRSVPLDVWQRAGPAGDSYLKAEHLAHRLRATADELRVDVLACITRHGLHSSERRNLYSWWPDGMTPPIVIFSAAGFPDLPPEGPVTDRVIANALVQQLAGFLGDFDSHAKRSRCPMWLNPARDFRHLSGPQEFDAPCRDRLARQGVPVAVLESLLRAFSAGADEGPERRRKTPRRKVRR